MTPLNDIHQRVPDSNLYSQMNWTISQENPRHCLLLQGARDRLAVGKLWAAPSAKAEDLPQGLPVARSGPDPFSFVLCVCGMLLPGNRIPGFGETVIWETTRWMAQRSLC